MQLFLPEMDPSQDSEPGMYVRVLPGVSPAPGTSLGNTREQWAEGNPEPSIQPGAKHPRTPFQR